MPISLPTSESERIEDEFDMQCYTVAKKEYEENPVTYSMEEVAKELGIELTIE